MSVSMTIGRRPVRDGSGLADAVDVTPGDGDAVVGSGVGPRVGDGLEVAVGLAHAAIVMARMTPSACLVCSWSTNEPTCRLGRA
jgi:hypothetical protein